MGILLSLAILTLAVVVHEWGHYIVMRRNGVRVLEFSIFIGPALHQWTLKSGMVFSLRAIPFGGYVNFATKGEGSIGDASGWARFKVYMAGMFVNSIAAFITLLIVFYATGIDPDPFVQWSPWVPGPGPLHLPLCAFVGSFGIWIWTPVLFAKTVAAKGLGFVEEAAGPIGILTLGNALVHQATSPAALVVILAIFFAMLNGAVAGFNILPLHPLDGGQVVALLIEKLTGKKMGRLEMAYRAASLAIFFVLALLIIGGDFWKLAR